MYARFLSLSRLTINILHNQTVQRKSSMRNMEKIAIQNNQQYTTLPPPIKSENDEKVYKVIRLSNGLTACLISDVKNILTTKDEDSTESESEEDCSMSEATSDDEEHSENDELTENEEMTDSKIKKVTDTEEKMAATGLCIGVGSFSDIKEIPGLAHFLEHMVFMGSKKFPQENDFDAFIKKHGGFDNAATDCETTVFYFECLEKHLFRALDKFAQFFISPLMKRTSMTREREVIESEFQMSLPSDSARKEQLLFNLFNPKVPVNQFTWGNLKTLRDNVTDDFLYEKLHEFRKRHYSAHRMTLAIQARLPIDELEDYVLKCFSAVSNNNLPPDNFEQYQDKLFENENFAKLYYIEPVKEILQVDLIWVLPSLLKKYKTKPYQYIAWLLGHEGKGSLISYLRKKVWVLSIFTGNDESGSEHNSMYTLFTVHMVLTREGHTNLKDVITAVYSYIKLMCANERIFKEIQTIENTCFRFADEREPMDFVEDLCEAMYFYPSEDYITGSDLFFQYIPEDIDLVLTYLKPEKMNITVLDSNLSREITYDKIEPWFNTRYTALNISDDWIEEWKDVYIYPEFHLPTPNQFLTTNFDLLPATDGVPDYPIKILNTDIVELWYRKDQKFKLPIAFYYFHFTTPFSADTPLNECLMELFVGLLNIQLIEEAYPAEVAGLSYKILHSEKGFIVKIDGYNEKLPVLINLIATYIINTPLNLNQDMFDAIKDKLIKSCYNRFIKPSKLAKELRMSVLLNKFWTSVDKYKTVDSITFEMMQDFSKTIANNLYIQALVQGNVTDSTAIATVNNLIKTLNCKSFKKENQRKFRVYQLPFGAHCTKIKSFNNDDANSIITNYYQAGKFDIKESVIIELIMMLIEEPLFDTLRTKEQLGYDVHCTFHDTFGITGYSITVNAQAVKNTVLHVDKRIELFIKSINKMIKKMPEKKLNEIKGDLIKVKQCADVLLKDEVNRNWGEILKEEYFFNREKEEIKEIENIKLVDVKKWWEEHNLFGDNNNCKKLSIQVEGHIVENSKDEDQLDGEKRKRRNADDCVDTQDKSFDILLIDNGGDNSEYYIKSIDKFQENLTLYPQKLL